MNKMNLKPARVFEQFAKINEIPRPSKHEEKMTAYLQEFGKSHGLETIVDEIGNVLIKKPATPGYENRQTVILQSHQDMVCDKLVDVEFDFNTDAIQTYVDGEWLKAKGTTLGADDGIGCAIELAILDSDDIEHGPLECVFTVDEETQLTGASAMKPGFMSGTMLINLDSEDEGEMFVSCAGGRSTVATFRFTREDAPKDYFFVEISLKGLTGGHSGDDINKRRANAIKILSRFVYNMEEKYGSRLVSFNSGKLHNAIPRDGRAVIAVPNAVKEQVRADWNVFTAAVEDEFHVTDTSMAFKMESTEPAKVISAEAGKNIVRALQAVDNGIFAICQDEALGGMVETSSNIAVVKTSETEMEILASQRSNVMSNLDNQCNTIKAVFQLAGAEVIQNDGYPAWKMNPNSQLTKAAVDAYKKIFGKEPIVRGIHAGLECGLFSEKYPELDMVSFGPTLRDVHTPDERLLIPTVQMVWDHLLEMLKHIPNK
ncbi:MAG: aminoacyl-histidine dipeptidase [Prevotella pleuritidis]|jgi:Xaa-His dipeptidase|uniref:Cytosol non-specific dipeptidase n=2 Tax=Hoylesella TaxID=2974257 RepID=A0A0S2KLG8_9BACT|nr:MULTISPECIES: aminoacyl-histidine dipeptidase [Hoylesella]ALO49136.1 aminoacyl-histidine dipeptidase [Hoylesella enoeca]MBF1554367.1 aminoacyl-histidine dipeptidase [Hoylesella pleuritidis]